VTERRPESLENLEKQTIRKFNEVLNNSVLTLEKSTSTKMWEYVHKRTQKCFAIPTLSRNYVHALPTATVRFETLKKLKWNFANCEYLSSLVRKLSRFEIITTVSRDVVWKEAELLHHLPSPRNMSLRFYAAMDEYMSDSWLRTGHRRSRYNLDLCNWICEVMSCTHHWRGG
jgi:hypothetical protein